MRAHSCQHLLSAILLKDFNILTSKAVMNDDQGHLYLEKNIPFSIISTLIKTIFQYISNPILITNHIIKKGSSEDQNGELISLDSIRGIFPEEKDYVRLVAMGEIDLNTCGGTHLPSTSDILAFSILSVKKSEIQFYSGKKAIKFIAHQNQMILNLSKIVQKPSMDSIQTAIDKIDYFTKDNQNLYQYLIKILFTFFEFLKTKIHLEFKSGNKFDFSSSIKYLENKKTLLWRCWSNKGIINLILECKLDRKLLLESLQVFENDSLPYLIIIVSKNNTLLINVTKPTETVNAKIIVNQLIEKLEGKGGGSKKVSQLVLNDIDNTFNSLYQYLKEFN